MVGPIIQNLAELRRLERIYLPMAVAWMEEEPVEEQMEVAMEDEVGSLVVEVHMLMKTILQYVEEMVVFGVEVVEEATEHKMDR